jgi:hypothetical protein
MCEYCGCDAIPAIAELTAEHDAIREVAWSARKAASAGDRPAARVAVACVVALLEPHTRIEEIGLFPALAGEFGQHTESLVAEHRALETGFAEICGSRPERGWEKRLTRTLDILFEHILREQDGLFPAALSVLTPEQWDAIDDVRSVVRSTSGRRPSRTR